MILALASGGNGAGPRGRLLAVDAFVSGKLVGAAGQGPLEEVFHVTYVSRDEGRRIVDAGDASRPADSAGGIAGGACRGGDGLVVRHVIIFGHGHGLQRAIIDESQHRTPERLIMAQH